MSMPQPVALLMRTGRRYPLGLLALAVVLAYAAVAVAVSLGWQTDAWSRLSGGQWEGISAAHWWGTNLVGQDIFARAMVSTRTSFVIGLQVAVGALILGAVLGAAAGMWLAAVLDAIPFFLLAMAVAFAFDHGSGAVESALVLSFWTTTARLVRAEVLRLQQQDFVAAARMAGLPAWRIAARHLLPNTVPVLVIQGVIVFVLAIKSEVLLSFIGLGVRDEISWGVMLAESTQEVLAGELNNFLAASLLLSGLILALNLLADALQDWLDPRQASRREVYDRT